MERVDVVPVAGLDVQVGLLLAALDNTTAEWRQELGDVPDESIAWQAFPGGHSIGALLLHMADVEANWLHEVAAGRERTPEELQTLLSGETHQYQVQWPAPPAQPLAWYYARQDAVRARTRELVAALNDPEHTGKRPARRKKPVGPDFTLRWLLTHVISHEAYHGGQAVLLSLMRLSSVERI